MYEGGVTVTSADGRRSVTYRPSLEAVKAIKALNDKLKPGEATHEQLVQLMVCKPTDFEPWGERERDSADCSCGCKFYHTLEGHRGADWGVCWNPASPRVGLLTFEHQGCPEFFNDPRWEQIEKGEMRILKADRKKQEVAQPEKS